MKNYDQEKNEDDKPRFTVTDKRQGMLEGADVSSAEERLPTFVEKLKQEAEEKDKRLREYIAAYKAKTAENDEFRARLQRENENRLDQFKANLFAQLVPILDNLKRASQAARDNRDFDRLHEGIEMIVSQFTREIKDQGVTLIEARGRAFDPSTDEVFITVETEDPAQDNRVVEDLEPGYMFREKLIKPVKVKVAKLKKPPA
ncbi:MAG: nucleotide exchange factor GrpE [Nitrospinae bacterium]|nr:nucleotide exchange factor GrpE [Nitrospinota bacterium]